MHTGGVIGCGGGVSHQADTSLWGKAAKFNAGGIVGGLKSRERAIIAKDEEAIFSTVRISDSNFGIRATGFTEGGGSSSFSFGDINIKTQGSSGNAQQDQEHTKMMAREARSHVGALVNEVLVKQFRSCALFRRMNARGCPTLYTIVRQRLLIL
ncbi:hypothetical protein ASF53_14200 [Methylobacterium sp. Leaf123]|uniref:hypothetical protein n=1 Tax=Methylobacterium sp. Leaf123 TaxID=1736264 RepID=UPI0006FAFF63|nr:hypothetical protein [Methylobacterium sp. Leaf123]KQQ13315.1 hypothetical protein ASF53_14200 [Methylobacterium sp. Leaf123]